MFCEGNFATVHEARRHLQNAFAQGGCSLRKGGNATAGTTRVEMVADIHCQFCKVNFPTLEVYNDHIISRKENDEISFKIHPR